MPKQLISVSGRAENGISRPFLCEDKTGQSFFVKRGNVEWDQLVLEYMIGNLAQDFGIQMAPFELVEIPELLANQSLLKQPQEFEPGIGFGSVRIPFGEDLGESHLRHISDQSKIELFCFDWWVSNPDRRLSFTSVSSNLLWDPEMQLFAAIDHDRCLEKDWDETEFFREHIFRDVRPFVEKAQLTQLRKQFEKAVKRIDKHWKQIPEEWLEHSSIEPEQMKADLLQPKHDIEGVLAN